MARASKTCSTSGCPNIVTTKASRCTTHIHHADSQRRPTGSPYSTPGHTRRFRPGVLAKHPVCVLCRRAPATIADHYPHSRAELLALALDANDPRHGRGLCKPCHDRATSAHQPGGWHRDRTQ